MAFYKDAPNKKPHKKNYAAQGSWDDEGTHYSSASSRRFGPNAEEGGEHKGGYRTGYKSAGKPGFNQGKPAYNRDDREGGRRFEKNDRFEKTQRRPAPRREESAPAEAKSYRDFEHRTPVTAPVENDMPRDNLLSGRNPIREALRSGRDIEKLLVQKGELSGSAREIVQMAREARVIVQEVEKSRLDEITPHHQGMLAFASAYKYSTVEEMLELAKRKGEDPFLILLDGVTDPHNLGAIIRSAECVGAHGVIVPERRSVGLTPAAVKSSAGAVEHMKVARVTNLTRTIDELKQQNVWTYAVTMNGQDYMKTDFRGGVALVIGAEGEGISRLTLEHCDQRVSLPMKGAIDSLNASVAAGVMMYRVLASRK